MQLYIVYCKQSGKQPANEGWNVKSHVASMLHLLARMCAGSTCRHAPLLQPCMFDLF